MKKKLFAIVLAIVVCVASVSVAFAMSADEAKQAAASVVNTTTDQSKVTSPFIDVVKSVQGSVVGVNNYQNYTVNNYSPYYGFGGFGFGFGGGSGRGSNRSGSETTEKLTSTGSGVVVYDHVVLTNYHVVEDATRLTLSILNSDDEIAATVVAYDESLDVAVVYAPDLNLTPVALGDSDQLQVGEWSICIGNPLSDKLRGDWHYQGTLITDWDNVGRSVWEQKVKADYVHAAADAVKAGNDDDARKLLATKQQYESTLTSLETAATVAEDNAAKMRQMHDKLVNDIEDLKARRETIKAKMAVAKTQEKVAGFTSGADKAESAIDAFNRMEEKADRMLDTADAMAELSEEPVDDAEALEAKYAGVANDAAVEDELARLKADMGL